MIERHVPEVGYGSRDFFAAINVSPVVKANGLIHFAGVGSMGPDGSCLHKGNMRAQLEWVLEVLKRMLEEQGLSIEQVVSTTVYTTDMEALVRNIGVFQSFFEGAAPTSSWLEVIRLGDPDYLVEISAIASG